MRELHLFAGGGGGIYGGILCGHVCCCAVEIEPYRRAKLLQRQRDGIFPRFPIWDDVRTFDGKPWRGRVDIVAGGFPCQDIAIGSSTATGILGARSGLWKSMLRVVREIRPRYLFVENSPALLVRGLGTVLSDLAAAGYDAKWGVFSGRNIGAPIERERIFIAGANQEHGQAWVGDFKSKGPIFKTHRGQCPDFWLQTPSKHFGMEHGVDNYRLQVEQIGDGQIPAMAAFAWQTLSGEIA